MIRIINKKGMGAGQWGYLVAMVLALMAIAFFAWIIMRSRGSAGGVFDDLNRVFGVTAFVIPYLLSRVQQ